MRQPPLARIAADAARRSPDAPTVGAVVAALTGALGPDQVSTVEAARRAASTDFAHLSPVLSAVLPPAPADVVVYARTVEDITTTVRIAHAHGVPVTPRGAGTGNYGQAVPLARGVVVDLTRCDRILDIGDGWVRAEAGATFVALEAAARREGQEIAMSPTTVGSTIGGFMAGGAGGVGSIEHGFLWEGFVRALDVVTCPPAEAPTAVMGEPCAPYLHAYGVTGVIATATVRLAPWRERVGILASFPGAAGADAIQAGLGVLALTPPPRLVSLDDPDLVVTYPADDAMPPGRYSLRAIVDSAAVDEITAIVTGHGGQIEAVRPSGTGYVASLGFNHVTLRARRTRPDLCHLQIGGEALVTRADEVRAAVPGSLLHLDGLRGGFGGLLLSPFRDPASLYEAITRLEDLGVHVVDPHTWLLGGPALPALRTTATANDPTALLNPGKLPPP